MKTSFHPYAIILGIGIGIVVLLALRHPPFALFFGIASIVLIDMGLTSKKIDKDDKK